ncbi:PIN domain-containing protein [Oscillatoria laete-virens NRMC-F 0139]|nr:TA system VapC family ribonuclease toxin [Oscillatoria laete-virens]MDL5055063.1 PIN domain-containing protein [Oscillatoria laete-virens NRMC-F 0139]
MMSFLVDSNVWVALTFDSHPHHKTALKWFDSLHAGRQAVMCRMVEMSFLRLITTPAIFQDHPITNRDARHILATLRTDERVGWRHEPEGIAGLWLDLAGSKSPSPKKWMDAYLAAFAILSGLQLASFDAGFTQYQKLDFFRLKESTERRDTSND